MKVKIKFYETSRGRCPPEDFISRQPKKDRLVLLAALIELSEKGFNAKGCQFRHLKEKLWEVKIKTSNSSYRFLYFTMNRNCICVLHAFKKKTQKTPKKEIGIALKRIKEFL